MSGFVSWNVDPDTGDYVMDAAGKPVNNNDLKTPAYFRLTVGRTRWLYAPDTTYGSDFYLFKKKHLSNDPSTLEAVAQRALQPMIDDGRASAVTVNTTDAKRYQSDESVQITDAQGIPQSLSLDQIGV